MVACVRLVRAPRGATSKVLLIGAQKRVGIARLRLERVRHVGEVGRTGGCGLAVAEELPQHGVKARLASAAQAKADERDVGHRVALGHEVARIEHERPHTRNAPVHRGVLAKLVLLGLALVMLAVAVQHVARHQCTVARREHPLRPRRLEELDGIRLRELGVHVARVTEGHTQQLQVREELHAVVQPGVVLPHTVHHAHHAHLLAHLRLDGGPLRRALKLLSDGHERADDGVHAAPREKPQRARVVVQDCGLDDVRARRGLPHIALKGNVSHVGAAEQLLGRREGGLTGSGSVGGKERVCLAVLVIPQALDPALGEAPILRQRASLRVRPLYLLALV